VFLTIVFGPVGGEDPLVRIHPAEGRSTRHGHDHANSRDVDARLIEELGRAAEDPYVVLVEPEHDSEVDRDPVAVKVRDDAAVIVDAIVRLVGGIEAVLRDRLQAQKQRLASAPRGEFDELLVACGVRRALAGPPFLERGEGPEEFFRVPRIRADVVVPEHDRASRARRDLPGDFVDRTIAHSPRTVEQRDRTVVAAMGTAARGNGDRFSIPAAFDEVPAWCAHAGE